MALRWKLSGNNDYADAAVKILNDWASTCTEVTSNDANQVLAAGAQGYTFANAAELMQSYSGWNDTDKQNFKAWSDNDHKIVKERIRLVILSFLCK